MTRVLRLDEAQYAALQKAKNERMAKMVEKVRLEPSKPFLARQVSPKPQKARGGGLKRSGGGSEGEVCLAFQLVGVPGWEREYRFAPPRRWRFDFAFPGRKLGIEVEGGVWISGRHNRGAGFEKDRAKYNAATMGKWAVLRFSTEEAKNGYAYRTIMEYLKC